jgi:hypothetical protein
LILQLFKKGTVTRFMRMFIYFTTFESVAALISKYLFNYNFCTTLSAGRGWNYALCFPGTILSSGVRLTGFGGEPAIFATYLALTVLLVTWAQFDFGLAQKILIIAVCTFASLISGSTTGTTLIFLSLALISFQRLNFRGSPFVLTLYSASIYYLFSTKLIQNLSTQIIQNKLQKNAGSVLDRNLNLGFEDYLRQWGRFPFGSQWNGNVLANNRGINLLADSLGYGPLVIIFMFLLAIITVGFSKQYIQVFSTSTILFITMLVIEPAWANAIWFILFFTIACVNLSEGKKARTD